VEYALHVVPLGVQLFLELYYLIGPELFVSAVILKEFMFSNLRGRFVLPFRTKIAKNRIEPVFTPISTIVLAETEYKG